ncbi:MAG TPA: c-type cytochrome, partial [Gemmataceae bacterium]|nr:c-type cytochrome [Gemmataceae bacterium]
LLIWYAMIPVADTDPAALVAIAGKAEIPLTRKFMARRLAEDIDKYNVAVSNLLELTMAKPEAYQQDILDGLALGLKGMRKAKMPPAWDALAKKLATSPNTALRNRVRELGVILGDPVALEASRKVALDPKADLVARKAALEALIDIRPDDLRQLCEALLGERFLNAVAARGLASFDDPAIGPVLVKAYPKFDAADRPQLIAVLVSRPAYAKVLLDSVADKTIPRADISAFDARQIRSFNDEGLNKKLALVWGEVRDSPADKKALIAKWKAELTSKELAKADKSNGRALFNKTCATCHTLHGEGAAVGPDLTGGGRQNLDFLLGKVLDPSAAVSADFRMSVLSLKDGRVLNGIVTAKTERTLTLKTTTDAVTLELGDIESTRESLLSLMPDGMLEGLTTSQVRDLIAYLMNANQVALPDGKGSSK